MGSLRDCTWILGLTEYRVVAFERDDDGRLVIEIEQRGIRRYRCSGCGRRTGRVRDAKVRTWDDLPWAEHPVTLRYALRRLWCRHCGIRTERVGFADPHARLTRRFRQRIGLDCQSMPTSHAAVRHAVSWGRARRAEHAFLAAWDRARPKRRPWHLGVDEIQRGKGQHFWTVLSDLVRGEVIGLQKDRSEDSLRALLKERLDARQRAAVEAVCMDMHRPYLNVVTEVLPRAEAVFDKFHVLQHASAALDDVRRQEFFRAGPVMRKHGRGKRWLLLRRWKTVRGSKRAELQALFAANRRLFKVYVLREQLDRLWTYKTRTGVLKFLNGWCDALRWQRLPEMDRLGEFLFKHLDGIDAYCDHQVRFGVVESINTTIKAVLRRARGMRDETMLVLKLKWATARPIRSARDVRRFSSSRGRAFTSVKTDFLEHYDTLTYTRLPCNSLVEMIASFGDATTEDLFHGANTKAARSIDRAIWSVVRRKLDLVNAAASLEDLRVPPGNRLEALKGDQKGRHRIRVNDQYRVTFRFENGTAHDVRSEDYY